MIPDVIIILVGALVSFIVFFLQFITFLIPTEFQMYMSWLVSNIWWLTGVWDVATLLTTMKIFMVFDFYFFGYKLVLGIVSFFRRHQLHPSREN